MIETTTVARVHTITTDDLARINVLDSWDTNPAIDRVSLGTGAGLTITGPLDDVAAFTRRMTEAVDEARVARQQDRRS